MLRTTIPLFPGAGSSSQAAVHSLKVTALTNPLLLPIAQSIYAHWAETTELLNFDMVRSSRLKRRLQRLSSHLLFAHLSHAWMARLLSSERLFVNVELLLPPHVDFVLLRGGKHVIQLAIVFHGRHPVLGQAIDRLLLRRSRTRYDLKASLSKEDLFPGGSQLCVVGGDGLT